MLCRNAVFFSLTNKGLSVKSKFHKGISSTDCDQLLNTNLKSTDVYKNAAGLVRLYPPKHYKHFKFRLSCKSSQSSVRIMNFAKKIFEFIQSSSTFHKVQHVFNKFIPKMFDSDLSHLGHFTIIISICLPT